VVPDATARVFKLSSLVQGRPRRGRLPAVCGSAPAGRRACGWRRSRRPARGPEAEGRRAGNPGGAAVKGRGAALAGRAGVRDGRGHAQTLRFGGGPVGVPSRPTSPRAITPRQGGKPGNVGRRSARKVAPLTQRDRATPGQTGWNTKPPTCVGTGHVRGTCARSVTEDHDKRRQRQPAHYRRSTPTAEITATVEAPS